MAIINGAAKNPIKQYWIGGKLRRLPPLIKTVPYAVDVRHNPRDFMACLLAGTGFSNKCISRVTGLTVFQISYRVKKGNVNRQAARDGNTPIAKRLLNQIVTNVAPIMTRHLPKALPPTHP